MKQHFTARLILLVLFGFMFMPTLAMASGQPRLWLSTESVSVAVGKEMIFELRAEGAAPTVKAEAHLRFDPTIIRVVEIKHGDFLASDLKANAFILENEFDNEAGTLDYAILLRQDRPAAEGDGLLATITFQALAEDVAPITIQDAFFFDQNGGKVVVHTTDAKMTVADESAAEFAKPNENPVSNEDISSVTPAEPAVVSDPVETPVEAPATESQPPVADQAEVIDTTPVTAPPTDTESWVPAETESLGEQSVVDETAAAAVTPVEEVVLIEEASATFPEASTETEPVEAIAEVPAAEHQIPVTNQAETIDTAVPVVEPPTDVDSQIDLPIIPRRITPQSETSSGNNSSTLYFITVTVLGLTLLTLSLLGFFGLLGGWFWLARFKRR